MWNRSPRSSPERSRKVFIRIDGATARVIVIGLGALAMALATPGIRADVPADDPSELVRTITSGGPYQTTLPEIGDDETRIPLWWAALAPLVSFVLIALLVVGVGLLLFWLSIDVAGRWRRVEEPGRIDIEPRGKPVRDAAAEDPRWLAGQGMFGRAIHALLQRAILLMSSRTGFEPERCLTSRELLRRLPLEGSARDALAALVSAVELSHFGGAAVSAEDYSVCLTHFRESTGADEP